MKLYNLFLAVTLCVMLSSCSDSPPSPDIAEEALRQDIQSQSDGHVKLVSFKKTDGQKFVLNGIPGYSIDYEAEIEFDHAGSWLSGGYGPDRLAFGFSGSKPQPGTMAGFVNGAIEGGKPVDRGSRVKITGSMTGAKKESGWKFASAKNQIAGPLPVVVASPAAMDEATRISQINACVNNLRLIDAAKQQWALENAKSTTETPSWDDLKKYLGRGASSQIPTCAAGGAYTINAVKDMPTCSIPDHALP